MERNILEIIEYLTTELVAGINSVEIGIPNNQPLNKPHHHITNYVYLF